MKSDIERRKAKNLEICRLYDKASKACVKFFGENYRYDGKEAVDELGLDDELIHQLLEDYVVQILTSVVQFEEIIETLDEELLNNQAPNYTPLQELVHKNLGVARNLRIKDAEELLAQMMKEENLKSLSFYLKILESCAIRLKPTCAYNTLKLIEVKNSF